MLHKTSGIILRTTKYSESSLIVKVYTRDFGLQTYITSGSRNKKSKSKANLFQPLALVDMVVSHSEKGGIQRLSEINSSHPYISIPNVITKNFIVLFLNEILYKSIKEEHSNTDFFDFIKSSLLVLDLSTDSCANFHIFFMLQLSKYLGFFPQGKYENKNTVFDLKEGNFTNLTPNHSYFISTELSKLLFEFIEKGYDSMQKIEINNNERKQLLQSLISFYQFHIVSFGDIKSLKVLENVIAN